MMKSELKQRLINENIPEDLYSLEGGLPNESYCLAQKGIIWEVYYSERGKKSGMKSFTQEDEACNYFYHALISMLQDMGLR